MMTSAALQIDTKGYSKAIPSLKVDSKNYSQNLKRVK